MKKPLASIISIAILSTLTYTAAYAKSGKAICERNIRDYDDIHCTYLSGLPQEDSKYIKHTDVNSNFSYTTCVSGNEFEYGVFQEMGPFMTGTQTIQYAICSDLSGSQCEALATDTYTVVEDGEKDGLAHYVSQPSTFGIDVSAVKGKYPSCYSLKAKREALIPFTTKR